MRISFGLKIGLAIFLMALMTVGFSLTYFYNESARVVKSQMQTRLYDLGMAGSFYFTKRDRLLMQGLKEELNQALQYDQAELAGLEDGDTLDGLDETQANDFHARAEYQQLVQLLRRLRNSARRQVSYPSTMPQQHLDPADPSRIKYTYLFYPAPNVDATNITVFLADADYEGIDMNGNGQIDEDEESSPIGTVYRIDEEAFATAWSGRAAASDDWYTDRWGTWMSSYTPIVDQDGGVIAVLGIDLDVTGDANKLNGLKRILIINVVISIVAAILLSILLAVLLHRPIKKLQLGAEALARRDFDVKVDVRSRDELGRLADTFNDMVAQIRDYAQNLESRVEQRTAELQESLEKVQALKHQQDGDYFLTNLLTNPLFKNWNTSNRVQTDFIIKQKKSYRFRKWDGQLGGDLCITATIPLGQIDYTMVLNADAMGKSMQGAGGALVMGTVVNSIIKRSHAQSRLDAQTPQVWLQDVLQELHDIFLTFDGSMAISCFMALIHPETGDLHYFNAEHPFPVLFRNGKASFFQEEMHYNKLGMMQRNDDQPILSFKLEAGDTIFIGSDGKDDLLLPVAGGQEMNFDENLFLEFVEKGEGQLDRIVAEIEKSGELSDDLSLLQTRYVPSEVARSRTETESRSLVDMNQVYAHVRQKEFRKAIDLLETLPAEKHGLMYFYYMGLCKHKLGQSQEALEYLQTAVGLNRNHAAVPGLLGWVYHKLGHRDQAESYWKISLQLDPTNKRIQNALDVST